MPDFDFDMHSIMMNKKKVRQESEAVAVTENEVSASENPAIAADVAANTIRRNWMKTLINGKTDLLPTFSFFTRKNYLSPFFLFGDYFFKNIIKYLP